MEKNPTITKAFLEKGYIEKIGKAIESLHFTWNDGTAADNMIKTFKENHISWDYDGYGSLRAELYVDGKYRLVPVEYYAVENNLYGIIPMPKATSEYFGVSPEELYKRDCTDETLEHRLLVENNIHEKPYAKDLYNAVRKANDYAQLGCEDINILRCVSGKYAVVAS